MKVEVFKVGKVFNTLVGQYQGNVEDLLDNSEYNVCSMGVCMLKII